MKVKIFTEGGLTAGYGHLSRCFSLYEEIENRKIDAELIVDGDFADIGFLKNKKIVRKKWIDVDFLVNTITQEDYVIVDSYQAQKEHYDIISLNSKKAIYIDDYCRLEYPKGVIVNPALDSSDVDYSNNSTNILLTGPNYVILRSSFIGLERKSIKSTAQKVLITMGGTDPRNLTSVIIKRICMQNHDVDFHIVVSNLIYDEFNTSNKLKNVFFHKDLSESEMSKIMMESDFAITAAGQTIYELIATQTPFLAIQVAKNQQNNIRALMQHISPKVILNFDDECFLDKLENSYMAIKNYDYRKGFIGSLKNVVDGNGRKRIVEELLRDLISIEKFHLRNVQHYDVKEIFELSNKDYVRKYSINKNKILWNDHVKWFNSITKDDNIAFYIVTDVHNTFQGQIRYKIEEDNAIVSISLSDRLKGKGLSKVLLKQSIDKLFKEKIYISNIIAYVSVANIPSMKIFKGLNFKEVGLDEGMTRFILRRSDYYVD